MNIPQEVRQVLDLVKKNFANDAVIAGGCLRDADNDRPINDIDVFVGSGCAGSAYCALLDAGYVRTKTLDQAYLTMDNSICCCSYFERKGSLPVNVIEVYGRCDLEAQLERFDFGICAIGWDGKNLIKAQRYQRDQQNETFTLTAYQSGMQREYSLARFDRLSVKYPGWTLVK
jgi:hypothetical protein